MREIWMREEYLRTGEETRGGGDRPFERASAKRKAQDDCTRLTFRVRRTAI